jgi:hypothetical protein
MNEPESIYKELFNGTDISGWLPSRISDDSLLDEYRLKRSSNINIGRGILDPIDLDSIRINVSDVYISLSDVAPFVLRQKDALPETERQNLTILLNADSSVSKKFLSKVVNQVNNADSTLKIYQATFDYQVNKVYYRKINQ